MDYKVTDVLKTMDDIVRDKLIAQLAQEPSSSERKYSERDFNDSLDYYPKNKEEGLRLRMIRDVLYTSVSKIGTEMIPASRDFSLKPSLYP